MDNSHKSSCPICQRWFMVLFLKSEAKELALTVFPVNMKNPEPEFKEYHATPPVVVLVQENVVLTDNLRIEQYICSRFTSLDLTSDKEAERICSDVYIVIFFFFLLYNYRKLFYFLSKQILRNSTPI
jgi:hypothetical protein